MISLKKLIMRPGSPDKAMEQAYYISDGALARIAHVNRLSRDINDIKFYELDMETGNSALLRIFSKKGIVDLINVDDASDELFITLQNSEITQEREKFYLQLTVYVTGSATPIIFGTGFGSDTLSLKIVDVKDAQDWGLVYFYYDIVKLD
jgi:hypothetical protein